MAIIGDLKLRLLLSITQRLLRRGRQRVPRVRQLMRGEHFVLQIQTAAGSGGYFEVMDGAVTLHYRLHAAPDFCQTWRNGQDAFRVLTSHDETDLLRAFEAGLYRMRGDFLRALWFNEVIKLSRGTISRAGS